jgi:hypothetical protein
MNNLQPKKNIKESELFDNDEFLVKEADGDNAQNGNDKPKQESPMDEQQLRIESLKIATKISKLFDNVQPSDLLEMSDKVYNFIQHQNNSGEYDESYGLDNQEEETEETPDETEDFEFNDEEETPEEENASEEEQEGENEKEETSEESEINPEDIFDFEV